MFTQLSKGASANDGTGTPARSAADLINAVIQAANLGQLQSYRNKLINGDFRVWQRGTSFAINNARPYTADRWFGYRGTSALTISRQTGFSGAQYCARVQRDAGDTSASQIYLFQQIETVEVLPLAGGYAALCFDVRSGANYSDAGGVVRVAVFAGTGTDELFNVSTGFPTGNSIIAATTFPITTTAARVAVIVSVPSVTTELCVRLGFTPSGTAGAADYFEVTNAQVEPVDPTLQTVTNFEQRPIAAEVALCERFCQKSFALGTTPAQALGTNTGEIIFPAITAGATTQRAHRQRLRRMRAAPSVTTYNPASANAQVRNESTTADCSAVSVANITEDGFDLSCTGDAGAAGGHALGYHFLATAEL